MQVNTRNVIAIDFETGGLKHWECAITQVGAVHFIEGTELDTYHSIIKPEGKGTISQDALDVQGVTYDYLVKNGRPLEQVAAQLSVFLWDAHRKLGPEVPSVTVAHNGAGFDFPLLSRLMESAERGFDPYHRVCTFSLAVNLMGSGVIPQGGGGLKALCKSYGIDLTGHHEPVCDARACGLLYLALMEEVRRCQ